MCVCLTSKTSRLPHSPTLPEEEEKKETKELSSDWLRDDQTGWVVFAGQWDAIMNFRT